MLEKKIDFEKRIKSKLTPIGEQSFIQSILLIGILIFGIFHLVAYANLTQFFWIIFIGFLCVLIVSIINWITEREWYLEKKC